MAPTASAADTPERNPCMDADTSDVTHFVVSTLAALCHIEPEALTNELECADLGLDSLNLTSFSARLESTFDCELNEAEMLRLFEAQRVEDLIAISKSVIAATRHRTTSDID
jgi:acyl carrier protein